MIFYGIELAIGTDVKSLVVEGGTVVPTTNLAAGRLFFNTTTHSLYFFNGTAWVIIGGGQGTFVTSFCGRTGVVTLLSADLPTATTAIKGAIRVGSGLSMNGDVLSITSLPTAAVEIPTGSKLLWAQPIAPVGWTQITDVTTVNRLLRVVNIANGTVGLNGTGGGGYGGSDSPILNDKIPNHTHHYSTTTNQVNDHYHGNVPILNTTDTGMQPGPSIIHIVGATYTNTSGAGVHTHTVAGNTDGVVGADNWSPQYLNLILCRKGA